MKRYLALIVCLISLCLLLCFPVQASAAECTISEDLQTLNYAGQTYTHVNSLAFDFYYTYMELDLDLSEDQLQTYSSVTACITDDESLVEVTYIYPDGTKTVMGYLLDLLVPDYEQALTDDASTCTASFWSELEVIPEQLKGTPVTLDTQTAYWSEEYRVSLTLKNTWLSVVKGTILINGTDYYYVDLQENNVVNRTDYNTSKYGEGASAYKITDPEICEAIAEAYASENTLGLGIEDAGLVISGVLLSLIFGLLPGVILILSLILSFCSKDGFYRKLWRILAILCAVELLIFVIVVAILLLA